MNIRWELSARGGSIEGEIVTELIELAFIKGDIDAQEAIGRELAHALKKLLFPKVKVKK